MKEKIIKLYDNRELLSSKTDYNYNWSKQILVIQRTKTEQVKSQLDVNILGNVNILSACLPMMRKNNFGRIVGASSILSSRPLPGTSLYSASKSFIETLYKTAALENSSKNINKNLNFILE